MTDFVYPRPTDKQGKPRKLPRVLHRLDKRIRKQGLITSGRWLKAFLRGGRIGMPKKPRCHNMKNYLLWIVNNIDLDSDCFHTHSLGVQIAEDIKVHPSTVTRMTHEMIRMGLFVNPWAKDPTDPKSGLVWDRVHNMQMPVILQVTDEFWRTLEMYNEIIEERDYRRGKNPEFNPVTFLEQLRKKVIDGVYQSRQKMAKFGNQNRAIKAETTREGAVRRITSHVKREYGTLAFDLLENLVNTRLSRSGWKPQTE